MSLSRMEIEESAPAPEAAPEPEAVPADAPVAEASAAPELEAPADEAAEPADAPVVEEPAPVADPYEEFGGRDNIESAHRLWQASQTEEGVVDIFVEAARILGISNDKVQALFDITPGADAEVEEDPDLDEPMTRRQFLEEQTRQRQEAEQAAKQSQTQQATQAARDAVQATFKDLKIDGDEKLQGIILQLGEKHFDRSNVTPESAAAAVRAGHAEYQAIIQAKADAYVREKAEQAETLPSAPSGAGPAAEPPAAEPANVAEAIARTRAQLFPQR